MPQHRRVLYHEFRDQSGLITCQPDAAALLTIPHPSGEEAKGSTLGIFFEIDRSTEGLAQCLEKIPGYAALSEQRAFVPYWPQILDRNIRVFWIVPSHKRIANLAAALRKLPGTSAFRFIGLPDCQPDRLLTEPVWYDVKGNSPMTLYRKAATDERTA